MKAAFVMGLRFESITIIQVTAESLGICSQSTPTETFEIVPQS